MDAWRLPGPDQRWCFAAGLARSADLGGTRPLDKARAHLATGPHGGERGEEALPTGIALHDAAKRLFEAAERVLVADGPNALSRRSVTVGAGVAKGVLDRHFTHFDDFLAAIVVDRVNGVHKSVAPLEDQAPAAPVRRSSKKGVRRSSKKGRCRSAGTSAVSQKTPTSTPWPRLDRGGSPVVRPAGGRPTTSERCGD
jgi:hypothetical protein